MSRGGAAAFAGLVVAGAVHPVGAAFAAEIPDAVQDVQITADTVGYWDKLRVDLTWAVPNSAAPGDTFQLQLPEQLEMVPGYSFPLAAPDGKVVANAVVQPDGRTVVFELTDYVNDHENVAGNAWFESTWNDTVEPGTTQTLTFKGSASTFQDTVTIGPLGNYTGGGKWQNWSPNPAPYGSLNWGVMYGKVAPEDVGKTVTFTDTPGSGQQVDCDTIAVTTYEYLANGKTKTVTWQEDAPGVTCDEAGNFVSYSVVLNDSHVGLGLQLTGRSTATTSQQVYENTGTVTVDKKTDTWQGSGRKSTGGGSGDGDQPKVSVGDYVWLDSDKDGIQDADESGIPGVVLTVTGPDGKPVTDILGNPVGPQTTDADGKYAFTNLPPLPAGQSYTVTIDKEASTEALKDLVPTTPGAGTDRGADSSTDQAKSGDLTADGAKDLTLDFGFHAPASVSVGDYVWLDADKDGIQDAGESGIPGVVLTVTGPDGQPVKDVKGNPVGPVTTGPDGKYSFDNLPTLPAGQSYTVTIDKDASADALKNLVPTTPGAGTDRGADSSTDQAKSGDLTTDGAKDLTLDFGFHAPPSVTVGDYVWLDSDKDGIQDSGESGIKDVVLKLTGPDGQPVTDVLGNPVGPQTTDENGKYLFPNLPPLPAGQSYTVTIDKDASSGALKDLVPTTPGAGTDRGADSSTDQAKSGDLTTDGTEDLSLDFGFHAPSVSVGDYVWKDLDGDGIQDGGEPGIPGVVLKVTGPDGQPVQDVTGQPVGPVTTGPDGKYSFDNLPPLPAGESYTVTIDKDASAEALKDLVPTVPGAGDDRGADSSTDQAKSGDLTTDGAKDLTLDFGFRTPSVSVGDKVWNDLDNNGIQNVGEPGIPGVVLTITGPGGQPVTDVHGKPVGPVSTDSNGEYTFELLPVLPPGQHYVVTLDTEKSKDALNGFVPSPPGVGPSDTDSSTGMAVSTDLTTDGAKDLTLDFGFHQAAPVPGGTVPGGGTDVLGVQRTPTTPAPPVSNTPVGGDTGYNGTTRRSGTTNPTTNTNTSNRRTLARTGSDSGILAGAGLSLIAAGSVLAARRRRTRTD